MRGIQPVVRSGRKAIYSFPYIYPPILSPPPPPPPPPVLRDDGFINLLKIKLEKVDSAIFFIKVPLLPHIEKTLKENIRCKNGMNYKITRNRVLDVYLILIFY